MTATAADIAEPSAESDALRAIVTEAAALTGAQPPALLDADAPTLESPGADTHRDLYLVGVIGGKDVGKSSLVNALAGADIAAVTASGPGTESALAYAHESRADQVLDLLRREVDPAAQVIPHRLEHLLNQVLLDLPDIDSLHERHIAVTRRALRHLLFPLWAQSIEKYADLAPRQLLKAVAEGNDPANFTFVLTKADQAAASPDALDELRRDYASRLTSTLRLSAKPDVYLTSSRQPDAFDLPRLRAKLSRQRPRADVRTAIDLARARRSSSLLTWFDRLDLPARVERLKRVEADAVELLTDRIGRSILDRAVTAILEDPAPRGAALEEALARRLSRWPLVGLVHTAVTPLALLARRMASPAPTTATLVDFHLRPAEVSTAVRTTFAVLQQTHPSVTAALPRKPWEASTADAAVADLRLRLTDALDQRQRTAVARSSAAPLLFAPIRWLLTIGVLLWFPVVQPILKSFLQTDHWVITDLSLTIVTLLSVQNLLANLTFLIAWFAILYLALRRGTARKVARALAATDARSTDPTAPATVAAQWLADLSAPFADARRRLESLLARAQSHRR